jgi:tRNA A-37 threonylcarbamoyl transferase component Bud32
MTDSLAPRRISIVSLFLRLHEAGLCHEDMVPQNVVYSFNKSSEEASFRLIDLGRAAPPTHDITRCHHLAELRRDLGLVGST